MNRGEVSVRDERAVEEFQIKHGPKLPWIFIAFFAALCAAIERVSPAGGYDGHFFRLLFFGGFIWVVCRQIDRAVQRYKRSVAFRDQEKKADYIRRAVEEWESEAAAKSSCSIGA